MTVFGLAAVVTAGVACVSDLQSRRIPNALTLGAAVVAVIVHISVGGVRGLGLSVGGWAVGLVLFLPFFALKGIGGGDVKLLAALGAWLGPISVLWLGFWSSIAGGVFALTMAMMSGYAGDAFRNVWGMFVYWRVMGPKPHPGVTLESTTGPRLPYSLPIAAGLGMTLWLR